MSDKQIQRLIEEHIKNAQELKPSYGEEATIQLTYFQFLNCLFSLTKALKTNERIYMGERFENVLFYFDRLEGLED